jgi:hypothetical protein
MRNTISCVNPTEQMYAREIEVGQGFYLQGQLYIRVPDEARIQDTTCTIRAMSFAEGEDRLCITTGHVGHRVPVQPVLVIDIRVEV